jgi:hypothetical protein
VRAAVAARRREIVPHIITVPVNENGIIFDSQIDVAIQTALQPPFDFGDVFVYSHGWSTNADSALDEYGRFSIDFAKLIMQTPPASWSRAPRDTFGVGIHWPSEITEDPGSDLNALQLLTFYTMEHRADGVGKNAVYTMIRLMLEAQPTVALRVFLIGHSFGCRVMCAALQDLQADLISTIPHDPATEFHVALLEPAMDEDNLDPDDIYGNVVQIPNLRLLISKSSLDKALGTWFPLAGKVANLLHKGDPPVALGFAGPTQATQDAYGGMRSLSVDQTFTVATPGPMPEKLITADLTPLHQWDVTQGYNGGFSGSHSDIFNDQVRSLLAAFFFGPP